MKATRTTFLGAILGLLACHHGAPPPTDAGGSAAPVTPVTARTVLSHDVIARDGRQSYVQLAEVTYAPGASSKSHSHPCPVVAYVVEGAIRSRVDDEPEAVYSAGQSFYEKLGAVHAVSANASNTARAKLLAVFLCDSKEQRGQ